MSARLEAELGSVAAVFSSFLECVQKLRDSAVNTQSSGESIYLFNTIQCAYRVAGLS